MLNPGDIVDGKYRIVRDINRGMFAIAYEAVHQDSGQRRFLKEYISPRVSVPWYRDFVRYQEALNRALRASPASHFAVLPLETFEASKKSNSRGESRRIAQTLFQSFEFIETGIDLEKRLTQSISWPDRRKYAAVFVYSLLALHQAGIVHADLKPANVQFVDVAVEAGTLRPPRLIDMDFSIIVSRRPPWHGHQGYVGSPGYTSPEHVAGGEVVPSTESDMFSAGLILHELLGKGHPLSGIDSSEHLDRIRRQPVPPVSLRGSVGSPADDARVVDVIGRCLRIDRAERPSAAEMHAALVGAPTPPTSPISPPPPPRPTPPTPRAASAITLGDGSHSICLRTTTVVGRPLLARFGNDAQFAATDQFRIERRDGGAWWIEHLAAGGNQTLVNGEAVLVPRQLRDRDRVAVGNAARGIERLQLTVSIER